jgi:hypothetical protein
MSKSIFRFQNQNYDLETKIRIEIPLSKPKFKYWVGRCGSLARRCGSLWPEDVALSYNSSYRYLVGQSSGRV